MPDGAVATVPAPRLRGFLLRTRGRGRADWTDWACYAFLLAGLLVMLLPVAWLLLSSLKSPAGLDQAPPTLLPYEPVRVAVPGRDGTLPLVRVTAGPAAGRELAEVRRIGTQAQLVDPADPGTIVRVPIGDRTPVQQLRPPWRNYTAVLSPLHIPL